MSAANRTPPVSSATPIAPSIPASNTAAVVTLDGAAEQCWVVTGVHFSYDADPTAGSLVITHGSGPTTKYSTFITSKGAGPLEFTPALKFPVGEPVTCTLAAGGSGVSGHLNVLAYTESP